MAEVKPGFTPAEIADLAAYEQTRASAGYLWKIACVTLILTLFGLTMLYSTSAFSMMNQGMTFFRNQLIWIVLGGGAGTLAFLFGYRRVMSLWWLWLGLCAVLLALAVLCFPPVNGAQRWIRIPLPGLTLSLQPSELTKLALVIFAARYCTDNFRYFNLVRSRRGILPLGGVCLVLLGGILAGRDYGTTLLAGAMVLAVLLAAGLYLRYLLVPVVLLALLFIQILLFDPTRVDRIFKFLHPEEFAAREGYQLLNSLYALGSGGWFGQGFMESRLKAKYLPEAHTDFILAIVGEELGLVTMLLVILGYAVFTWLGVRISLNSGRQGALLGFGLTMGIALQAAINLAVITGSAPTKGMNAPFISYGGSNLLMCLISVGLLMSIAAETAYPDYNQSFLRLVERIRARLPGFRRR